VNWTNSIFSIIDLRSFSNLWFWLVLAVAWSNAAHFIMGVPFDMVTRARRQGGQAMADLELMAALQARRRLGVMRNAGVWLVGFWMAVLTSLAMIGFVYRAELAQAVFLLLGPLTLAAWLGLRLSARIEAQDLRGEALARAFFWHRVIVQAIGLMAIFVTTLWGAWHTLSMRAL